MISIDYELFGDGSGDVNREQIIPTNHLMDVCELHGAHITCFIEMGQFLFYDKHRDRFPKLGEANDQILMQIKNLVRRGHDVQLHYHPTWFNAKISSEGCVKLDLELFDISQLQYEDQIQILKTGKEFLENELRSINPDYECIAFRAGALTIGDHQQFSDVMRKTGLKVDSSVVMQAHSDAIYGKFDYRVYPDTKPFWKFSKSIQQNDEKGDLLEFPILGVKAFLAAFKYKNYKYSMMRKISNRFYKTRIAERNLNIFGKLRRILSRDYYFADFNNLTSETIIAMIVKYMKDIDGKITNVPIMLIGHSKSGYFNDDLHILFSELDRLDYNISYETISSYSRKFARF